MNKIDRIRRKLEENKKKSIFQEIKVNSNLSFLSQTQNPRSPHSQLPNTLSVFPIIAKQHSHQTSTSHSERSLTADPFQTESTLSGRKTNGSIFMERAKIRTRKMRLAENVDELAAKTLTPSSRINWASQKQCETTPLKNAGNCIISAQTASTVIILTHPQAPSESCHRTLFRRTIPKRQSLAVRKTYTPPEKGESPTRKFSISPWEAFDEE